MIMSKKITYFLGILVSVSSIVVINFAMASFVPGETLNPGCSPADPTCTVTVPRLSNVYVVADTAARDALLNLQAGDIVVVTDVNESFVRTQTGTWQKFSKSLLANVYLVTSLVARDALTDLQAGDIVVVADGINETFVRTQSGTWQAFSKGLLANNFVVPDQTALDALSDLQAGDTAVVTSTGKSFVRTQTGTWQELLSSSVVAIKNTYVVTDNTARDSLTGITAGDVAVVTSTNSTYIFTQDNTWQQLLVPATSGVTSVNNNTGTVSLNSDDIPEGVSNRYFTDSRSRNLLSSSNPITYDSLTGNLGLSFSSPLVLSGLNLTVDQTQLSLPSLGGVLTVAKGGTNSTAIPTNGGIVYGTGSAYAISAAGTSGQVLKSNGAAAPTWIDGGNMMLAGASSNAIVNNTTMYFPITSSGAGSTTDSQSGTRSLISRSGTIKNLHILLSAAIGSLKTGSVTVMKNGVATALVATLDTTNTSFSDTSDVVSVIAGDEIGIKVTVTSNTSKFSWSVDFGY